MTEPAPNQHGQVIGLVAIATMALPRAAALCTCAAHARHPSTSCLFQQQAVDVFLQKKKEKKPRGCATGPALGPPPNPLPSPVCDTPAFVTGRRKGEFSPLQLLQQARLMRPQPPFCCSMQNAFFQASCCDAVLSTARIVVYTVRILGHSLQVLLKSCDFSLAKDGTSFSPESGHFSLQKKTVKNVGFQLVLLPFAPF